MSNACCRDLVRKAGRAQSKATGAAEQSTAIGATVVRCSIRWAAVDWIGRFSMVGWRWVSPVHRVDSWGWTGVGRDPRRVVIGGFTWTHIRLRRRTGVVVRGWGRLGIASEGVVGRLARLHAARRVIFYVEILIRKMSQLFNYVICVRCCPTLKNWSTAHKIIFHSKRSAGMKRRSRISSALYRRLQ
jgi:hypothetical protein